VVCAVVALKSFPELLFLVAQLHNFHAHGDVHSVMASSDQIAAQILSSKSLSVSPTWLNSFLSSGTAPRNVPASALAKTATFRLLASDIRESLSRHRSCVLPTNIANPNVQELRLQGPIPVQVLDIEDIGTSLWSQIEAIERIERGEAIRGREIVRTIAVGEDPEVSENNRLNNNNVAASGNSGSGPHRLMLQDAAGTVAIGFEMHRTEGIALEKLAIGAKLLLRNFSVARGMVLLTPSSVTVLGGKIEALDKTWKEGRKARLLEKTSSLEE
jgi:RecQ-mediated genome instability protein 1